MAVRVDDVEATAVRIIATVIAMVLLTALALLLVYTTRQVLVWMIIAVFFTVALAPVVDWIQRRLSRCSRIVGTIAVYALVLVALGGLITLLAGPGRCSVRPTATTADRRHPRRTKDPSAVSSSAPTPSTGSATTNSRSAPPQPA